MRHDHRFMRRLGAGTALLPLSCAVAVPLNVPGDFPTIQAAINAATDGDEVIVAAGTYNEQIDFLGLAITVRSTAGPAATTIDGAGLVGTVVRCVMSEGAGTVLQGFTITGGGQEIAGGMLNLLSSPTVIDCVFDGNTGDLAAAMLNFGGDPMVIDCVFRGNTGTDLAGGMYNAMSNPTVVNCTFLGNTSVFGAGMYSVAGSTPSVVNCTFGGNSAGAQGGGLYVEDSSPTVTNCIFWGNSDAGGVDESAQVQVVSGVPTVNSSCVQGGWSGAGGVGNIDSSPQFVDELGADATPGTGDEDLRLGAGSPCIDAGDNTAVPAGIATDLGGAPRFVDAVNYDDSGVPGNGFPDDVVDMGAFEADALTPSFMDRAGIFRAPLWFLDTNGNSRADAGDTFFNLGLPTDRPVWGDWNGDGFDEVGVYRDGLWFLDVSGDNQAGAGDTVFILGLPTDVPVWGDWNGDGVDEVGIFRSGLWFLDSNGNDQADAGDTFFNFGLSTDTPVRGDWNGDGIDEVGIYRDGLWFLDSNGNNQVDAGDTFFNFGLPTDTPMSGDWNGDGVDEVGIYRGGLWFLDANGNQQADAGDQAFGFGLPGDTPVPGRWASP